MSAAPPDRRGAPAPLILHLASAAEIFESGARLAPLAATERFPWAEPPSPGEKRLATLMAGAPAMEMGVALRLEGAKRLSEMLDGLRLWRASPFFRDMADPPEIWRLGSSRLLDFGPEGGRPVLVVPSLINRHHILDLDHDTSLLRWLSGAGLRPFLLDWGEPGPEESRLDLSGYVARRLLPAFDAVRERAEGARPAAIGYCMGGTLTLALAALRRDQLSRLALIGAPWDFSAMKPMHGALASLGVRGDPAALTEWIDRVANVFGALPVIALQAVFAQLDPGLAARKFRRFARFDQQSAAARSFVLIEDWLNAGPPLSGPAAREALIGWHMENRPMRGLWEVEGERISISDLGAPTLIAAATADRIAPPAAAAGAAAQIPGAEVIRPAAGHVGMIVGRGARNTLWRPLADFLLA